MRDFTKMIFPGSTALALGLLFGLTGASAFAATNDTSASTTSAAGSQPNPTLLTPAAPVASTASPAEEDIRDIRQPRYLPTPWSWVVATVGVIALTAAALAVWRFRRKQQRALLPHELALQGLSEARKLMNPDSAREYCFEASQIIRRYIEAQFRARAPRLTTEEFLRELVEERDTMFVAQRELLGDFLRHCDLAKFAGWRYSTPDLEAMHASAEEFVQQTAAEITAAAEEKRSRPASYAAPVPETTETAQAQFNP